MNNIAFCKQHLLRQVYHCTS